MQGLKTLYIKRASKQAGSNQVSALGDIRPKLRLPVTQARLRLGPRHRVPVSVDRCRMSVVLRLLTGSKP
jgi:hypothetical protein